jgi:hypothetical protein
LEFRPYTLCYFFEHLGNDDEEQQWANYRLNETPSKGVMMWGILTNDYNNLTKGYGGNISRMVASSRGFTAPLDGICRKS